MRARVRRFHSPDVYDLEKYAPDDTEPICALIELDVGADDDEEGADIFGIVVCSPAGLAREVNESGPMFARHHLVVDRWDWPRIRDLIVSTIEAEEAPTWDELAARIGRIAQWEFEDYRELPEEPN